MNAAAANTGDAGQTPFTVPPELVAAEPPEARGLSRDDVRLLVAGEGRAVRHTSFRMLPEVLGRGDLVVVNTSATEPAAVDGHRTDGTPVTVHVSGPAPDRLHALELRTPQGDLLTDGVPGEGIALPCGVVATLLTGHPDPRVATGCRLWRARIPVAGGLRPWLAEVGRPVPAPTTARHWPIDVYRTVFAHPEAEFGSAELPGAGRPFTPDVLDALRGRGIRVARVVLHTGLAPAAGQPAPPERYRVPRETAEAVNTTRAAGGRVLAVGATTTRALETVAADDGTAVPGTGWTHLALGPRRPARVVDGILTGWHAPGSPHLPSLEAVAGPELVAVAYAAALEHRYRWHAFGDSCLLLPDSAARRAG